MDKTRANRARAVQIEHKSRLVKHHAEQEVALYGSGWLNHGAQNRRIADLLRAMRAKWQEMTDNTGAVQCHRWVTRY